MFRQERDGWRVWKGLLVVISTVHKRSLRLIVTPVMIPRRRLRDRIGRSFGLKTPIWQKSAYICL